MAELDFSHNVQQIPAAEALPKPIQRTGSVETQSVPDYQGTISNYAEATNWMSSIGSAVATKASNQLAIQLGGELGKNPQGDQFVPLTDFDKVMQESYKTQAHATLSLQANKLITESNVEMASAPRITPDLIANTNKKVTLGLQTILKNAPAEIRPQLELQYGNTLLNQNEQLAHRMISEQRQDRRDTTITAGKTYAEQTYSNYLGGDPKAGDAALRAGTNLYRSAANEHIIDKETEKAGIDTLKVSALSGEKIQGYNKAKTEGKSEKYLKDLSEDQNIPAKYRNSVHGNVLNYINTQNQLRSQQENLVSQQMHNRIATDPTTITGTDWAQYESQVSPIQSEKMKFNLIQALKSGHEQTVSMAELIQNYGDGEVQARASEKLKNAAFFKNTQTTMQKNPGMNKDDAEVQVAMTAGAPVPVFVQSLNNKLTSGNPANIDAASKQIQSLKDLEAGHALIGVSKQAQVIANQYNHQKGSMPDSDLARKITDNILNIDEGTQKTLDNAWNLKLSAKGAGGMGATKSLYGFALTEMGINKNNLGGKPFEVLYGNDIYEQLRSNFDATRGDYDTAVKMTKEYVDQNYGETRINGGIQISDRPIEKVLGYKDTDVVPFIQQDLLNQMSTKFETHKDERNEQWTIKPVKTDTSAPRNTFRKVYAPAEIIRHVKTDKGVKEFSYPINLVGRPGNTWDVVVQTPNGPRNLFLVAPHLGITTYTPNQAEIRKRYNEYVNRGWF